MKKTIKLAVVAALALGATSAFATNGSNMMGLGAKSCGMGGTGIGIAHGAESALVNPALITSVKGTEISFGGTLFMPDVSTDGGSAGQVTDDSDADINVIPEVSLAGKITENFYMGVGMWGTAGMGTDYRDAANPGTMKMVTNLQLMQFGVPLAYKMDNFSVAVTPILQYGSLDMDFYADMVDSSTGNPGQDGTPEHYGAGVSQDLAFGYNLGVAYEIAGVTMGATYVGQIDMDYTGQPGGITELSTPATMGIGASYKINEHTIALDYKQINWEDAKGYEDFGWKNQNVIALGYEYQANGWAARLGYNYAESPIEDAGLAGTQINMFNLVGFPAITESHITLGGSYDISTQTSVDVAYVYSPESSETYDVVVGQDSDGPIVSTLTTDHSQTGLSVQVNYNF